MIQLTAALGNSTALLYRLCITTYHCSRCTVLWRFLYFCLLQTRYVLTSCDLMRPCVIVLSNCVCWIIGLHLLHYCWLWPRAVFTTACPHYDWLIFIEHKINVYALVVVTIGKLQHIRGTGKKHANTRTKEKNTNARTKPSITDCRATHISSSSSISYLNKHRGRKIFYAILVHT